MRGGCGGDLAVAQAAMPDRPADAFLRGGGEMARRIGAHDWSGALGPIGQWPGSLKTAVGMLVHSPVPIVLLWGADGIMVYNDAYSAFAGGRHPARCWAARCARAGRRWRRSATL